MYGLRELDQSVRKSFNLVCNPYDVKNESHKEVMEYLKSLGIIFYRDENNPSGILIQPDNGEEHIADKRSFPACKFSFDLNVMPKKSFKNIGIAKWKNTTPQYLQKHGDDLAWLEFNRSVFILHLNNTKVVCV